MRTLLQDLPYTLRALRRTPGFTAVVVLTLALGIGANTAVFSVLNAALMRRLPYRDPSSLVDVWPQGGVHSLGALLPLREVSRALAGVAAVREDGINLQHGGSAERLAGAAVTANAFSVLGTPAWLGRTFQSGEDAPGREPVAILSYRLWQSHFGADRGIIGRRIILDGTPRTVIGVMPPGFYFPAEHTDLWVPAVIDRGAIGPLWGNGYYDFVGRLRPGVSVDQAAREQRALAPRLRHSNPLWDPGPASYGSALPVVLLSDHLVGSVRTPLLILFGAVGFVLLIACVNVANLLLARAAAQQQVMAIRIALGASRRHLVQQKLLESGVLAVLGAVAGLVVAALVTPTLARGLLSGTALPVEAGVDPRVIAFTLVLGVATGLVVGILPGVRATTPDLRAALAEGGQGAGTGARRRRLAEGLVVIEVTLAVMLVTGAGLLIQSLWQMQHAPRGFDPEHVIAARLTPPASDAWNRTRKQVFYRALAARVAAIPGVEHAALTNTVPFSGEPSSIAFRVQGVIEDIHHLLPTASYHLVSTDYLRTVHIPLVRGRAFTVADRDSAPDVAMVSEALARRFWPGQDPIGQHVGPPWRAPWVTVVGVVGNVADDTVGGANGMAIYRPYPQDPRTDMTLVVRSALALGHVAPVIRRTVADIDPSVAVRDIRPLTAVIAQSAATPRFITQLLSAFAGLALVLGAIGIYGLLAHWVSQRGRDIGIRMALGATPTRIVQLVLGRGTVLALIGVAVGLVAAWGLAPALGSIIAGLGTSSPVVFTIVPALLLVVAVVASYVPAWRASRIDPATALRRT